MAILFVVAGLVSTVVVSLTRRPGLTIQLIPIAAAFAVMFPFWRGLDRLIRQVMLYGRERLNQRRFADARYIFEHFHRFGAMNLDMRGEAHFYLVQALIGLGELDRAGEMVGWLERYRSRWPWPEKAATALAAALRAQARRQAQQLEAQNSDPETEQP